jgi:hypothetical protein
MEGILKTHIKLKTAHMTTSTHPEQHMVRPLNELLTEPPAGEGWLTVKGPAFFTGGGDVADKTAAEGTAVAD